MKRLLTALLACLLLCGCVRNTPSEESTPTSGTAAPLSTSAPVGTYAPGSTLEQETNGALRVYPLPISDVCGIRALGDGLLVFSGSETTTITLLTGESLAIGTSISLDFYLDPQDTSLQFLEGEFAYYDPVNRQTVVLDGSLREVSHIAAPDGLVGSPLLSADRNILYYCTAAAIRAWDLETGIRRVIKELSYSEQTITGLHWNDTVLQCRILDGEDIRTLLISIDTGRLLYETSGDFYLVCDGERYYASFSGGAVQTLLFGAGSEKPRALLPEDLAAQCFLLPQSHGAVSVSEPSEEKIALVYYDLDTGIQGDILQIEAQTQPTGIVSGGDCIYLLTYSPDYGCQAIYRWDFSPVSSAVGKPVYTGTYYTAASPDTAGLAQCCAYAAEIGSKYGIEVLLWKDAVAAQPWDYDLEAEHRVPVLQRELELLDQRLAQYPDGFLAATASHFTSLKICLVRQLTGTAESGSLSSATGLQFFRGTDSYIALAVGKYSDRALYHELFHVMETHIWGNSIAFDQWEDLNPAGFSYDYNYLTNANRDSGVYLHDENRAFIDTYSMSFPKEDRARIMEYAMLPGNRELFRHSILQAKLTKLCEGIREAYGLRKSEEILPWEQYLETPLAYGK